MDDFTTGNSSKGRHASATQEKSLFSSNDFYNKDRTNADESMSITCTEWSVSDISLRVAFCQRTYVRQMFPTIVCLLYLKWEKERGVGVSPFCKYDSNSCTHVFLE